MNSPADNLLLEQHEETHKGGCPVQTLVGPTDRANAGWIWRVLSLRDTQKSHAFKQFFLQLFYKGCDNQGLWESPKGNG